MPVIQLSSAFTLPATFAVVVVVETAPAVMVTVGVFVISCNPGISEPSL